MTDKDETVMMLTERGMRILLEELSKGGQTQKIFARLAEPDPDPNEVDELVEGYLGYKEPKQENNNEETEIVVDFLSQIGRPVKLAEIREHMIDQGLGFGWTVKSSTQRLQKIMKQEPRIVNVGFGKYIYLGGDNNDSNETSQV